ncbi:MAG TPA: MlaD family protein [Burkholderiales bacterium]|nr:MlaD family protein [Burkholderiales bacterium]
MSGDEIPRARVKRRRLVRLVWIVPVIAIAVAAFLVWHRMQDYGPEITVTFSDGGGLRVGQTPVRYRGVQVGEVTGVALSKDEKSALVRIRLTKSAEGMARDGSQFWILRPRVGFGQITGLATVLSGPEIHVVPGKHENPVKREFTGLENPPVGMEGGLKIVLRAERPKMRVDAPVYYRGVEVGVVHKLDLAPNALSADVHVLIYPRYASLVREGSSFWDVSGVNVTGGLLKGIEVQFESLRAFITGGIEFATPPGTARAKQGTVFFLHGEPKKEWLAWAPKIPIAQEK